MKEIKLTHNQIAIIDDEDFELVRHYKWYACYFPNVDGFYAMTRIKGDDWKHGKTLLMHRLILDAPKGVKTDHENKNTLDNRRSNLRVCNSSQNGCNRGKQVNNTTGFKGVSFHAKTNKFRAIIGVNNKLKHLGCFDTAIEASNVYQAAAIELHKDFARIEK
jgi:hypothetical protein